MFLVPALACADSAQWNLDPISGDWNRAANWTPATVPNGPADIATFALSNMTNISISANTEIDSIIFSSAATNPYTITASPTVTLTISGTGITNNSGIVEHFVANGGEAVNGEFGSIRFTNNATAGSSATFTNNHGTNNFFGGITLFSDTSTAGSAMFINNNGTVGGDQFQGETVFFDSSTADHGTFINKGSTTSNFGNGGQTAFLDTSSAGNAMITNNGGAAINAGGCLMFFANSSTAASATIVNNGGTVSGASGGVTAIGVFESDTATAASATLIANGGSDGDGGGRIAFFGNSSGDTSQIEVFGDGSLDISGHNAPSVTIGSIEGDGDAFLGANNLTVGSNDLNTIFSGVIADGGFGALLTRIVSGTKTRTDDSNVIRDGFKIYESISSHRFVFQDGGSGGSLTKIGTGTLDLMGANTYTGDTNVNGGVLQIDGSIASNTFVNRSATLAGSGTVNGNVTNNHGGEVSPGDALGVPGVLTVADNYTQTRAATLVIQIGGAGQVSVLNVLGNANLNGSLDPEFVNGFVPAIGESFTFLGYASVTGSFSHIQNPVFDRGKKRWLLTYNPTSAVLTVIRNGHLIQGSRSLAGF